MLQFGHRILALRMSFKQADTCNEVAAFDKLAKLQWPLFKALRPFETLLKAPVLC